MKIIELDSNQRYKYILSTRIQGPQYVVLYRGNDAKAAQQAIDGYYTDTKAHMEKELRVLENSVAKIKLVIGEGTEDAKVD